jgi:hypothetical protein
LSHSESPTSPPASSDDLEGQGLEAPQSGLFLHAQARSLTSQSKLGSLLEGHGSYVPSVVDNLVIDWCSYVVHCVDDY